MTLNKKTFVLDVGIRTRRHSQQVSSQLKGLLDF